MSDKEVGLSARGEEMKKILDAFVKPDAKTGAAELDLTAFEATATDKVTVESVKNAFEHVNTYIGAALVSQAEKNVKVFEKNPELDKTTLSLKLPGRNNQVTVVTHRAKEMRNPQDAENPLVIPGFTEFDFKLSAGNAKSGEIGRARSVVKNLFADFGKK